MGLAIRKDKHGQRYPNWFGEFRDSNGKRVCLDLAVEIQGTPPEPFSLKKQGDAAFEVSRHAAQKALEEKQDVARQKGTDIHRVAKLIELKTGATVEYAKVSALPALWRSIDRTDGQPSEDHLKWCDSVFRRFAETVPCSYLYEVKPEHTTAFLDTLRKTRTRKTMKDATTLLRSAFGRFLPIGMTNPFGQSIRRKKARTSDGGDMIGRRPLTEAELDHLYETARPDPFIYPLVVCAACTGMRIGDVCRLRWKSVDLRAGWVRVATSKTGAEIEVPMFDRLRQVLETALAERRESPYVWPSAARMYEDNLTGITYRGKVLFARALSAAPQDAPERPALASGRVDLADALPQVSEAVQAADYSPAKRDRILDTITRYARGESYRDIQKATGRPRSVTSEDLAEAEEVSGYNFRKGSTDKHGGDIKTLIKGTRQKRGQGRLAASLFGWHNLRGTFVVLALDAGVPFETVTRCTGHTTAKTVRDHYYNPTRDHTRQAMRKAGKQIGGKQRPALNAGKAAPLATLAAQLKTLSQADRAQLTRMLKEGCK